MHFTAPHSGHTVISCGSTFSSSVIDITTKWVPQHMNTVCLGWMVIVTSLLAFESGPDTWSTDGLRAGLAL
jgi:hypothetical protein